MKRKRVLAIDPGSRKMGFAVVDFTAKRLAYVDSGIWDYSKTPHYFGRLPLIYQQLQKTIQEFSPDEIALEALIYVKSPTSLIKLAHARGAVIASFCAQYPNRVFEYAPNLIKTTVTGHGHASKEAIKRAVSLLLGIRDYESDDESDALAIALCHALHAHRPSQHSDTGKKRGMGQQLAHATRTKGQR